MTDEVDREAYRRWTPAAQERALERINQRLARQWRPFFCPNRSCNGRPHGEWEWNHARSDQHPPSDQDWLTWLLMSGRGSGKTRTAVETVHRLTRKLPRIAIIGATATDIREIMLEGESGILTIAPPDHRPAHEPSKKRLTWPNGSIGTLFSAEEPDRLRGPEHYAAWLDEPAHWPLIQECWDNMLFGLRLGKRPLIIATTTPKPRPWLKELVADDSTRVVTASTYDNLDNLSPIFAQRVIDRYKNTRLGQQELYGQLLGDIEGALWTWEMIEEARCNPPEEFDRIVVAIDPAGRKHSKADETGIIAVGAIGDEFFVLADRSGHYSPHGWASAATALYDDLSADAIIGETNFGADMVEHTLRTSGSKARFIEQHSSRGKAIRAEPVVGLYEQGKVHHTQVFPELEAEQTEWVPYETRESPNRIDALVFGVTELDRRPGVAQIASPLQLRRERERHLHAVGS